jgi:hypothetical protein
MKCFFDENLGKQLVLGLRGFGEDVIHLTEVFPSGTLDEEWLPYVGDNGYTLFTIDKRIRRRPLEQALLKQHKVGAFFLMGKTMSRWNYIRQIVRAWEKIEQTIERETPPFAYQINPQGTELIKIQID